MAIEIDSFEIEIQQIENELNLGIRDVCSNHRGKIIDRYHIERKRLKENILHLDETLGNRLERLEKMQVALDKTAAERDVARRQKKRANILFWIMCFLNGVLIGLLYLN